MSIVYIGHAIGDENGNARGGQPGDQTGRELCIQAWKLNPKGWRVLRAKDPAIAKKLAYDMKAACDNQKIGYDQDDRNTLHEVASKVGFDCARVTVECETDCSALVRVCCWYAGVKVGHFNTASEASVLLATGKFEELTGSKYTDQSAYLKAGDILITRTKGHTCIVLNDGEKAETSPTPSPEPTPEPTPGAKTKMIRVKGHVRCREGNGSQYKQIRPTVSPSTNKSCTLPYLGQATESPYWYKTTWQGRDGYISSKKQYTEVIEV